VKDKLSPFAAIIAAADPHGLLAGKTIGPPRSSEDEISIASFESINAFIDKHGVLPGSTDGGRDPSLNEYTLESHLEAFREEVTYRDLLGPYDRHRLLGASEAVAAAPATMAELIASDDPLLRDSAEQIFTLSHVAASPKTAPEEIAKRQQCHNFADFAPIFAAIAADLEHGRRRTNAFEGEASVKPGTAFIFHGLTAYVAEVETKERRGKNYNARTRVIFSNGTESNLLLRSFARALYDDTNPRQIIETAPAASGPLFTGKADAGSIDERLTGSIYIVESLSTEPSIAALRGRLYKIGFTTQRVEDRLANVEVDSTFLFAPVRIVAVFETVNLNASKLEKLLHQFFVHARLRIDVLLGRTVSPQEWFVVPVELVREAISRMLDGSIVNYRYDYLSRKIMPS
jgi:hypothetical protein